MGSTGAVTRNAEWVAREYGEEKWPAVERLVEVVCREEAPEPSMARVVARVGREDWYQGERADTVQEAVVGGRPVSAPRSVTFGGFHHYVVEKALEACEPEPQLVLELGSGWGRNLASLWLAGGPRRASYVGAEYTGAGRRAAAAIAALEPDMRFTSLAFDYHQPDLSGLGRVPRAVVLTVHSVEQIPWLAPTVIDAVRGLADEVECLHFEPVGWQAEGVGRFGTSREHAEAHDYNRNLLTLLEAQEAAGKLELVALDGDVVGAGTPLNATTLVHWRAPGV